LQVSSRLRGDVPPSGVTGIDTDSNLSPKCPDYIRGSTLSFDARYDRRRARRRVRSLPSPGTLLRAVWLVGRYSSECYRCYLLVRRGGQSGELVIGGSAARAPLNVFCKFQKTSTMTEATNVLRKELFFFCVFVCVCVCEEVWRCLTVLIRA